MNKLFIGNIDWNATVDQLKELFSEHGEIEDLVIITDKATGRSKGFGFVTFSNDEEAKSALDLDGQELNGRAITVKPAIEK